MQGAHHVPHPGGSRGQPGLGRWAKDSTADNLTADASLMETPNGLAVTPPPPATQAHGSLRAGLSGPVSHKLDTQSFGHLFTHQSMGTLPLCTHTLSCMPDHLSSSQALSELGPALASSHQLHPSCSGGPPPWLLPTWDQRKSVAGVTRTTQLEVRGRRARLHLLLPITPTPLPIHGGTVSTKPAPGAQTAGDPCGTQHGDHCSRTSRRKAGTKEDKQDGDPRARVRSWAPPQPPGEILDPAPARSLGAVALRPPPLPP